MLLVKATSLAPELLSETAPVKALVALVKVIALLPAVKLAVPGTVNAPVWVMAPPAVAVKLPALFKVSAGKAMAALSNCKVRLRKLVSEAKFVGSAAAALVLRKPTSRTLPKVPAKLTAPVMLLACVCNKTSEPAVLWVKVKVPGTVSAPD